MKLIRKIKLWWKFDGKYYHKDFAQGVRNLWKWFPTIWKDRDWDHGFIYEIIKVKLEHQAKYIGGHDRHNSAKRDAELMRLCGRLIQRCQDDHYDMEYMDYHKSNYDFVPTKDIRNTDDTEEWFVMEETMISERFDEYLAKYSRQYKRVLSGKVNRFDRDARETDKKLIAMEIAHENQYRCRKLLFKIMESRIEGWWD